MRSCERGIVALPVTSHDRKFRTIADHPVPCYPAFDVAPTTRERFAAGRPRRPPARARLHLRHRHRRRHDDRLRHLHRPVRHRGAGRVAASSSPSGWSAASCQLLRRPGARRARRGASRRPAGCTSTSARPTARWSPSSSAGRSSSSSIRGAIATLAVAFSSQLPALFRAPLAGRDEAGGAGAHRRAGGGQLRGRPVGGPRPERCSRSSSSRRSSACRGPCSPSPRRAWRNFTHPGAGGALSRAGSSGASAWRWSRSCGPTRGGRSSTFSAGEMRNPETQPAVRALRRHAVVIVLYLATNLAYLYAFPIQDVAEVEPHREPTSWPSAVGPAGASFMALASSCSRSPAPPTATCSRRRASTSPWPGTACSSSALRDVHPRFLTPHVSHRGHRRSGPPCCACPGRSSSSSPTSIFGQWIFFGLTVGAVIDPAAEAARPPPALPDVGLPGDAGAVHPGGAVHLRQHADQAAAERAGRVGHHPARRAGVLLLERERPV